MIQESDINKLEYYSKGLASKKEEEYIYSLFSEGGANRGLREYVLSDWKNYLKKHKDDNYGLSYLLDRIHHKIHFNENLKNKTIARKIYRWYSVAAAGLLIPMLIASTILYVYMRQAEDTVPENPVKSILFAPLGSRISFSLPDGTRGWLNSGSSLEYNIPFDNRQVTVLGEAWFDVSHDATHPFEVFVGNSKVKVLGTKFNLNAYPDEKYVEIMLEAGTIEFSTPGLSANIKMKPNEKLVFKDSAINISNIDASKYSAWVEGKLVFRDDKMAEVARRIERWYNVDIELVNKGLEKYVIRGTFQDDSLDEVLRYLSMTSPIRYRVLKRKILDDGTIQKRKVLIYTRKIYR